jgi:RHS repeat-associated protein
VTGITYPSSATNSFVYNGEDLRVSKTDSAGTSAQITDGTAPASPVLKDARAVYTPGISERAGTTSKFYHADALGSTRGITNSSQTVTDAVLYDAFGMTVSRTGSTATPFGFVGAQGYQSDGDSGLQLLGHRYYDPSIGRFLSSDPIQDGDNWYSYCSNESLSHIDASGLKENSRKNKARRKRIAKLAVDLDGSSNWRYDKPKDDFPANSNKCNKFVYDVVKNVGADPGLINDGWPPLAGDWANPKLNIHN